jgi:hypothetical protein
MISAYEHGGNAARHGKHIQACPFDSGTTQWREWRSDFIAGVALLSAVERRVEASDLNQFWASVRWASGPNCSDSLARPTIDSSHARIRRTR